MRYPSALVLVLLLCSTPSLLWAQKEKPSAPEEDKDSEQAKKLFGEAEAHYNVGEYDKALEGYKEAYFLSKRPELLFNMGQCYRKLEQYEDALTTYRSYLREVPDSPIEGEVAQHIADLEAKIEEREAAKTSYAKLAITTNPPGAQIHQGGPTSPVLGTTPYADDQLAPGQYFFTVTLEGYEPWTMDLNAEAGKEYVIPSVALEKTVTERLRKNFIGARLTAAGFGTTLTVNNGETELDATVGGIELRYQRSILKKHASLGLRFIAASEANQNNGQDNANTEIFSIGIPFTYHIPLVKSTKGVLRFDPALELGASQFFFSSSLGILGQANADAVGGYVHLGAVFSYLLQEKHLFSVQVLGAGLGNAQGKIRVLGQQADLEAKFSYLDFFLGYSLGF